MLVTRAKLWLTLFSSLMLAAAITAQAAETAAAAPPPPPAPATTQVKLTTSLGEIVLELDAAKAPKTVANFLRYVDEGFYNGTIFHRVIDGFMIQGGGFTADFKQKPTHEPVTNEADNGLRNRIGTIAMARTGDPQSATAQFFINVANNDPLDFREKTTRGWGYAVFGRVVKGMAVVEAMKGVKTGSGGPFPTDVPQTTITILSATRIP